MINSYYVETSQTL